MEKRALELPCRLNGYSRKKDRSVSIRLESAVEVSSDTVRDIDTFLMKEGWFLFAENKIQDCDIPKDNAPTEGKSQSKRLYDVLYVYWHGLQEKGDTSSDFNTFYNQKMERVIEHFKDKLPER